MDAWDVVERGLSCKHQITFGEWTDPEVLPPDKSF